MKSKQTAEFGDFQTPPALAREVCEYLVASGIRPASLLEPTCGVGGLLFAARDAFPGVRRAVGMELNANYAQQARATAAIRADAQTTSLVERNFFDTEWEKELASLLEPILVLGNPPWVTNSALGVLRSGNLPRKSNFQNRTGLDARTGKANFDVSEWMLMRLMVAMQGRLGAMAMLCKSTVARKVLHEGWKQGLAMSRVCVRRFDAQRHFGAAVDAALLVVHFAPGETDKAADVFATLRDTNAQMTLGYEDGSLLADVIAYRRGRHLLAEHRGTTTWTWRSGVKHDCARVMELRRDGNRFRNGLGELVDLEDAYLFPMLKSSHLAADRRDDSERWMLVPQRSMQEDPSAMERMAPRTWAYLVSHADLLGRRGSSIYRRRPPFSVFGVGDYSFATWKVAISGFYKRLRFRTVGPQAGKPVVLDDTAYFLPCETEDQAEFLLGLLHSEVAQSFWRAFVFWDAKRPITADLLRRLDLRRLAEAVGSLSRFDVLFPTPDCSGSMGQAERTC